MRFAVKHVGGKSERIGALSEFAKINTIIETPTAAVLTRGGSVAHLTSDVFARVFTSSQLLWMPLSNCQQLEKGVKFQGEGVTTFAGLPNHIACTTFHDFGEVTPNGHFERDLVPLWTRNGKQMISADRYMDIMEVFKPDLLMAIADSRVSIDEGHKRVSKSVERTCNMLDVCVKRYKSSSHLQKSALIGVLVGGPKSEERQKCMKRLLTHKDVLSGIALAGLTEGGISTSNQTAVEMDPLLEDVAKDLPPDLVRILEGCWNPSVIMTAIAHGWDIFDGTYPLKLTNSGFALVLKFDGWSDSTEKEQCILDVNDHRYKEDFQPLLNGCSCLTCNKHTRAYIHHLLMTREMLAPVLLNIHNLHNFDKMFSETRDHIAKNTFQKFRSMITEQFEEYRSKKVETIDKELLVNSSIDKKKKKKRLLTNVSSSICETPL